MHFISCIRCCWFAQQEITFSYFSLCSYLSRKWRKAAVDSTDNQAWICNHMCPCFSINHEIKFFSSKLKFWKEISESSTQVFSASLKDFILFSMPSSWNWHGSASGVSEGLISPPSGCALLLHDVTLTRFKIHSSVGFGNFYVYFIGENYNWALWVELDWSKVIWQEYFKDFETLYFKGTMLYWIVIWCGRWKTSVFFLTVFAERCKLRTVASSSRTI